MLLTIVIIISSILTGISPILFKKWIIVNIYPEYGGVWECVLGFVSGTAGITREELGHRLSKAFSLLDRYLMAGGLAGFIGYVLLVFCFRFGHVSTIFSMSSLQFVVTAVFSRLYLKEDLSLGEVVGMVIIIVGVSLLVPQA
jgi:uncharacterized membrane protein